MEWIHNRAVRLTIQIALGLTALAVFAWRVDLPTALRAMPDIELKWAIPGVVAFTASKAIHAYRWRHFLRHRELPFRPMLALFLTSNLANAVIPLRVGDLLRVEIPSRRFGVPRAEMTSSVFVVESVLDAVSFVALLSVGLLLLDLPPVLSTAFALLAPAAVVVFVLMVVSANLNPDRERYHEHWTMRWLPMRPRMAASKVVPDFIDGMRTMRDAWGALAALVISLCAWMAEVGVYWMMGQAFGLDLGLGEALVVMIAANLIVSLPITPWDVGPYEIAVTEALVVMGADRGVASSYALGSHLLLLVWIAITGVIAMWSLDLRPRDLLPGRRPRIPAPAPEG